MRRSVASDRDLDALLPQLSNWGRWGHADQLGTLNYLTKDAIRDARKLITDGQTVSLARAVRLGGVTSAGCGKLDIGVIAERGVAGRGVLLDIGALRGGVLEPGTAILVQDLEDAIRHQRVEIRSGDILLVRTGAGTRNTRERRAGLHPECLPWIKEKEIALLVSDGDSGVAPPLAWSSPRLCRTRASWPVNPIAIF